MTTFNIRQVVRAVAGEGTLLGPREIAAKVAENVPAHLLRSVLDEVLVAFVRQELGQIRRVRIIPAQAGGNTNSGRSSKVRAIRESWRATLDGQVHVGGGQWRILADCTRSQVLFLASERNEQARRTAAVAAMFASLANQMSAHRATRVGDLPETVLADVLTRRAVAA